MKHVNLISPLDPNKSDEYYALKRKKQVAINKFKKLREKEKEQ